MYGAETKRTRIPISRSLWKIKQRNNWSFSFSASQACIMLWAQFLENCSPVWLGMWSKTFSTAVSSWTMRSIMWILSGWSKQLFLLFICLLIHFRFPYRMLPQCQQKVKIQVRVIYLKINKEPCACCYILALPPSPLAPNKVHLFYIISYFSNH